MKWVFAASLAVLVACYSTLSMGKGNKREWLPSACYRFTLSVRDRLSDAPYVAKYVVAGNNGVVFVAEKKATDYDSAAVVFPDNFHDRKSKMKAWVNCENAEKYKWAIYANNTLIDSGTIAFSRNRKK